MRRFFYVGQILIVLFSSFCVTVKDCCLQDSDDEQSDDEKNEAAGGEDSANGESAVVNDDDDLERTEEDVRQDAVSFSSSIHSRFSANFEELFTDHVCVL